MNSSNDTVSELKKKIEELENQLKDKGGNAKKLDVSTLPKKAHDSSKNFTGSSNVQKEEALVDENMKALTKSKRVVDIPEEFAVQNNLVCGDSLILEYKRGGDLDKVKVAQRAKRNYVEALVTKKDDILYAVSQFSTHKLLNYDVQTKQILKGFELSVILPQDKESIVKVCVVKEVLSTGEHNVSTNNNVAPSSIDQSPKTPEQVNKNIIQEKKVYDPRVLMDDDLV